MSIIDVWSSRHLYWKTVYLGPWFWAGQTITKKTSISFKEYVFKDDTSGRKRYGVIADEVVKDHPELVHYNEKGEAGVDYISLLVKKVAELEAENNSLQEQINAINARLGIKK